MQSLQWSKDSVSFLTQRKILHHAPLENTASLRLAQGRKTCCLQQQLCSGSRPAASTTYCQCRKSLLSANEHPDCRWNTIWALDNHFLENARDPRPWTQWQKCILEISVRCIVLFYKQHQIALHITGVWEKHTEFSPAEKESYHATLSAVGKQEGRTRGGIINHII